jgi:GntR family transcriptional regulator, transcriptional repressor for pyruvate dehydrogenase complex
MAGQTKKSLAGHKNSHTMKPIERKSIIDSVVDQLKGYVLSGEIATGDKFLTEKEISDKLSVGRSTVREALRIMEAMGFIEIRPGRGAFVLRNSEDDLSPLGAWFAKHATEVRDYVEVRMAIETLAMRLMVDRATPEEISAIEAVHANFLVAAKAQDTISLARNDERFHELIVKATHNILLTQIIEVISVAYLEYRLKAFAFRENIQHAEKFHSAILKSIKNKNQSAGERSMREHLQCSLDDIMESPRGRTSVVPAVG